MSSTVTSEALDECATTSSLEALISKLRKRGRYTCLICGEERIGRVLREKEPAVCTSCYPAYRKQQLARLSKPEALALAKCPERYRGPFDPQIALSFRSRPGGEPVKVRGWPVDYRTGAGTEHWVGEPPWITLTGPNGPGKSGLAAELMYRMHRGGFTDCTWIRPAMLLKEDRETPLGHARQLSSACLTSDVIVIDELGKDPFALPLLTEIIEYRWSNNKKSIYTTQLPFRTGDESIKSTAPMIYDRLRDGLVVRLGGASKRGPENA